MKIVPIFLLLYIVFVHHVSLSSNRVIVPIVALALPSTDWPPQSEGDKGPEQITVISVRVVSRTWGP